MIYDVPPSATSATMSNGDFPRSIACVVAVPVSGQTDMDDMWMARGANKTNVTRQRSNLKTSCPQLGSETKFLGRLLIKTERGFLVKPLAKLFDSLLSCAGLENCNPVHSPGVRSESRVPDELLRVILPMTCTISSSPHIWLGIFFFQQNLHSPPLHADGLVIL